MNYYSNLLILQYHNKPKARATIEATTDLMPDNLIQGVINGFDINTAVGKQLDILGEYVGVDRNYISNGAVTLLSDDEYRLLLKLKIACNTSDYSHKNIDESLYEIFGVRVRMDSIGNMEMTYFVPSQSINVIQAAIEKNVLPKPMGVDLSYVIEYGKNFFAFCSYENQVAVYKTGFRDYNNPDKEGETFTYNKRIEV